MQITVSTIRGLPGQPETNLFVKGDTLKYDGSLFDLAAVPEGGRATPDGNDHPFVGQITRDGGEICCTVLVTLGDTAAPNQPADPAHWVITVANGPVIIPVLRNEEPE
jgi:hypothetical protein